MIMRLTTTRVLALTAALTWLTAGCMHSIHQVHVSDFDGKPYEAGNIVKASTEQFTILGFVTDTKYVDDAFEQLKGKCPKGHVQGITTQYSTSLGFFSWHNKILMQGLCVN
jgi:hypothetical protein